MCGIVGILGREPVAGQLVDALKRLEYRGYDSAGIATVENGHLERRRAEGKLKNLQDRLGREPLSGLAGIGHTRWATHGKPTENNAHPHATERLAVVHNGIIENFRELREQLEKEGAQFGTETDTEVVAHLVTEEMKKGKSPVDAVRAALPRLRGAFALAFIFAGEDDLMIGARKGSPLAIGHGADEMYLGSDALALAPFTDTISYLEEGDWAVVRRGSVQIFDVDGLPVKRAVIKTTGSAFLVDKGNHRHFMAKEIHEQPEVVAHTLVALSRHGEGTRRAAGQAAVRLQVHRARVDLGLRHRLLCRPGGEILVRALCAAAGRDRCRLRIPLPRSAAAQGRSGDRRLAIGRDRRHAGLAALRQGAGAARPVRRQCAVLDHRARKQRHHADAGGSRNRRGLDQGLHLPAGGAGLSGDRGRAGARRARARPKNASWCAR